MPEGWHSHKVRVANGIMIVNHEKFGDRRAGEFGGGLGIYDVSQAGAAEADHQMARPPAAACTAIDFDGRYAYISPTAEGYVGNIVMILDLADPAKPEEVGRWWIPGQWQAGGEDYPWDDCVAPRCHHPLRMGDRLYVSYWHHGFFILDISDMSKPKLVSARQHQPGVSASDAHLPARCRRSCKGRDIMIVADEDVAKLRPSRAGLRLDLRHHRRAAADADRDLPGAGPRHGRQRRSRR